jgi:hypothetical protein
MCGNLKQTLSTILAHNGENWVDALQTATFSINSSSSETTVLSPFFLNHGGHPVLSADSLVPTVQDNDGNKTESEAYTQQLSTLLGLCEAYDFVRAINKEKLQQLSVNKLNSSITRPRCIKRVI